MSSLVNLVRFLLRHSPKTFWLAVVGGLVSGASSAGLVALINTALHGRRTLLLVGAFVGLLLLVPLARLFSQYLLVTLGQGLVYDLRMRLSGRILSTPLRHLERLGPHRLLVALTDDITAITQSLVAFPDTIAHGALVVGCLAYMGWLSPTLLVLFVVVLGLVIFGYRFPLAYGFSRLREAREEQDALYGRFRGLTEGGKELKLDRDRRGSFLERLHSTADVLKGLNVRASMVFAAAVAGAWTLFFALVGVVVFVVPEIWAIPQETLVGYALILLFIRGPLQLLAGALPNLSRGGVALDKIDSLGLSLAEEEAEPEAPAGFTQPGFERLELDAVTYSYRGERGHEFVLGPVDLEITAGEVVFLVGGNGSGKTSLAKLLLGLYQPEAGSLRLDGEAIGRETLDRYRQLFSAVFFDFHLFDDLPVRGTPEEAEGYLAKLELSHKAAVEDGMLSTTELSQGQRKRLALLTAYLDDRPIYLFDEWAADQDPYFKEVFYHQLIPELKARGKTVLAISHDDRYYHVADRVVKLRDGQIVEDQPQPDGKAQSQPAAVLQPSQRNR